MRQGEPSKIVVKKGESFQLRYGVLIHSGKQRFDPAPSYKAYQKIIGD